jgi:hypothetical protein
MDIVVKFLRDRPADRRHNADALVALAMAQAFPCPK